MLYKKRGQTGEQLMFLPFILLALLVGGGIVLGARIYFSQDYDTRHMDASTLNYKFSRCLTEQSMNLNAKTDEEKNLLAEELFSKCRINKKVIESNVFALKIEVNNEMKYNWRGDEVQCQFSEVNENFPLCSISTLSRTINGATYSIKILTASNQYVRREPS